MVFVLSSKAFKNEGDIPDLYTCKGENISPPLSWDQVPKETKSFALVTEDLNTPIGRITHWILYNIPAEKKELHEGIPYIEHLSDGSFQGKNGMRRIGYMGPCPPWGKHRYIFVIYALDAILEYDSKINKKILLKAMEGHIIEKAQIIGFYSKRK